MFHACSSILIGLFFNHLNAFLLACFIYFPQVEHMLNDRLLQYVNIDLHEVKVL